MRYDFGGGCKINAYDHDITIVDIETIEETECDVKCKFINPKICKKNNYIVADIFQKKLILPEKATFINLSRVLRYSSEGGWLSCEKLDYDKLQIAAQNINNNLINNGIVRLDDHMMILEDVIEFLLLKKYEMMYCKMIEFRDQDYPANWEVILRK